MGNVFAHHATAAKQSQSRIEVSVHSVATAKCISFCQRCGKKIERPRRKKDSLKYCGKPCYFAAVREGKQRFAGRIRNEWSALVDWAHSRSWRKPKTDCKKRHPAYKPRPPCEVCGKETNHRHSRFCSYECKRSWRGVRKCKCGNEVMDATAFSRVRCLRCKREAKRVAARLRKSYRKRCRTYGGFFNRNVKPSEVFRRDKWKCHVCGKTTHKQYSPHDLRSATVDHHPIPLSKGGDHDWHNVRCACMICNSKKGNSWDGQQRLPLVGS